MSKGYDIVVISSEFNQWNILDINVIECLSVTSKSYVHNLFNQFKRTIRIWQILKDLKPDVVHIHSFDYIHPLMVGLVNCVTNVFKNLIISLWGTDIIGNADSPGTKRGIFAKRFLLKQAKKITATTNYLASATAELAPKGKKIHVIPFGIDCNMFCRREKRVADKIVRIGFIKHLTPKYGPDYLLKALAIVVKDFPNVHLTIVGHGGMDNHLKQLSVDLKIKKHVHFTGYKQYNEIPAILSELDIFVMPSLIEAFGVAAIEAQAMEVPVVASNVGGVSEAVLDGKTGILVEPRNVQQLAAAVIKLIKDPELRKSMGKEGRRFVLENYNLEENVCLFERLYQNLSEVFI